MYPSDGFAIEGFIDDRFGYGEKKGERTGMTRKTRNVRGWVTGRTGESEALFLPIQGIVYPCSDDFLDEELG